MHRVKRRTAAGTSHSTDSVAGIGDCIEPAFHIDDDSLHFMSQPAVHVEVIHKELKFERQIAVAYIGSEKFKCTTVVHVYKIIEPAQIIASVIEAQGVSVIREKYSFQT